ncbi:MAG: hypothetical protein LC804_27250, partial [Acidobacteria bacterium]|nr:hypothetical protein [Acidobacteriota bacterium]
PERDEDGRLVFSDFLNLFVFNSKEGLGGVVRALRNKGLFQSLAEPNLVTTNGKEASFLAGGEFPYPVVQGSGAGQAVTILFKEFGVRLSFTPTVLGGDLVNIKVRPEVSSLDFANGVSIEGFRVPALSTRRTETEVELRDGQTFAIAGLLNNTVTSSMSKIPGIGDIPILGYLFRSKAHQKNETELVVMITPQILRRDSTGVSSGLPNPIEPFMERPSKTVMPPAPYVGSPRHGQGSSGVAEEAARQAAPAAAPSAAPGAAPAMRQSAPHTLPRPASAAPAQKQTSTSLPSGNPVARAAGARSATPAPLTKEQSRLIEEARKQDQQQREAAARAREIEDKRQTEAMRVAAKKAEEDRVIAARKAAEDQKIDEARAREQARRDAIVAKRQAEIDRKKAEEERKRNKALTDAAERLKAAQAAYQAEVQRAGKGVSQEKSNDDKSGQSDKAKTPPSSK